MKIEYHEDIPVPAEFVFRRLTDFARHERQALARGVKVKRLDDKAEPGVGAAWDIAFMYRGKPRELRAEIAGWTPPEKVRIDAESGGLDIRIGVDVVALSARLTRVNVSINLMPRTITARLLVQSLRLARGTVTGRLQTRLKTMADEIVEGWARNEGRSMGR